MNRIALGNTFMGAVVATFVIYLVVFIESLLGLVTLFPPIYIMSLGQDTLGGYLLAQLTVGVLLSFFYLIAINRVLAWIETDWLRGAVYGLLIACFMQIIQAILEMGEINSTYSIHIVALMIAYISYGAVLALFVRKNNVKFKRY